MINFGVSVKNQMIGVLAKMIIYGILARVTVNVIRHVKLMNIQILEIALVQNWSISVKM